MKTTMKESSSTALLVLSALFLAPGMLILSPDGRLFFLVLAGLVAAAVVIAAPSRKKRIVAAIGLLLAVALAIPAWSEYRAHADAWKKHTSRPLEQTNK
jgi:flagellar biosynthesis protein FliP